MTSPTAIPHVYDGVGLTSEGLWHASFRSMASPVRIQLGPDATDPKRVVAEVHAMFAEVERQCTRFDADSDLMAANAAGRRWHQVGGYCFAALTAARRAHRITGGWFDPRVLTALEELGYDRSWALVDRAGITEPTPARPITGRWAPKLDPSRRRVAVGELPIDLGGIGKGLALRWAAALVRESGCHTFLVDAGGDCVYGHGPHGGPWRIGVEDPDGSPGPVAVLEVADGACATSSTRLHAWRAGGRRVHHLIDPHTGGPGGGELHSVTVAGTDAADSEVWSKVLFLRASHIAAAADEHRLAALWIDSAGRMRTTSAMDSLVIWRRP